MMNLSEMKVMAMNAVIAYFANRNWRRRDLMSMRIISNCAHRNLLMVYSTLFYAMLSATFGSNLHLFFEAGGLFTLVTSVTSLLCLRFTSPHRVNMRVSLLMIAAFFCGASVGVFTKYLFGIDPPIIANFLEGTTLGIVIFLSGAMLTRRRNDIYLLCLVYCWVLMFLCSFLITNSHRAHSLLKVVVMVILFMGYLVIYSQEIMYDAHSRDIDFVNRTLTIFFNLPAVVVHAARILYPGARTARIRHRISQRVRRIIREQNAPYHMWER